MKKFFLLVAVFFGLDAVAAENCNLITGQKLSDVRSGNEVFYANGGGYVCDKNIGNDECPYLAVIVQGNQAVYCKDQSGYTDTWVNYESDIRKCSESDFDMLASGDLRRFGDFLVGKAFIEENGVAICKSKTCWANSAATGVFYKDFWLCKIAGEIPEKVVKPECPAGSSAKVLSQQDCKSGERFECAKYGASNQCVCGKCIADVVVGKCHPSVCKSEVCQECCKRPASQTIWDEKAQVCQCVNGGDFQKENGAWDCKIAAGAVDNNQPYVCDSTLMAKMDGWRAQCVAKPDVLNLITELEEYCKGKPEKDTFLRLYDAVADAAKQCAPVAPVDDSAEKLRLSRRKIMDAHSVLSGMTEMFKTSVWKDAEGNFNTSRLVSDGIAGVVLGTVGGVVTSNVVKKNQVENGFEDIKCTIGGQTVADWGDQFRVGIQ